MNKINHKIFGEINFRLFLWEQKIDFKLFNTNSEIILSIRADENAEFEEEQEISFIKFKENLDNISKMSEIAIFEYYQNIYKDLRNDFGDDADEIAPIISNIEDMSKIVIPTSIYFPWVSTRNLKEGDRLFGILCDCSWDPSHGLAVKFINEEVVEVGEQDIIL